jgi:hypothetical protein
MRFYGSNAHFSNSLVWRSSYIILKLSFSDDNVFAEVFPIFRGAALIVLYLGLLGFVTFL